MMQWFSRFAIRMRMLFARGRAGVELERELSDHLDRQIAENRAAGMTAEQARAAALRAFGNPALLRDQVKAAPEMRDLWLEQAGREGARSASFGSRWS